jgi:hypothetical protein
MKRKRLSNDYEFRPVKATALRPEDADIVEGLVQMSSSRKWRIELKVDFDDEAKHPLIQKAVVRKAKELLATAMLLRDRRDPQVAVSNESVFIPQAEIELAESEKEMEKNELEELDFNV